MKLARYGEKGKERPALIDEKGQLRSLSRVVKDFNPGFFEQEGLESLQELDVSSLPLVEGSPRLGAPVAKPGKIIAVGLNYAEHIRETGAKKKEEPVLFTKAVSALSGPCDPIVRPKNATKVDWEVELVAVIGKEGSYLSENEALDHIAGFCTGNDISERSFQLERCGQWMKGKGCDSFAPIGPWLVTPDEIEEFQSLDLWLKLNGEIQQNSNTRHMIFTVPYLISYISQFMSLQPGDLVFTGTPDGVGMGESPQRFLLAGDELEFEVEGLGRQFHRVVDYRAG